MTALQIAKEHCANWHKDGTGCLGAMIDDDLQIRRCVPRPKCILGTAGERCRYFEECIAPMATSLDDPRKREEFAAAVRDYRKAAKLPCADDRPCPNCGRAMEPKRRFCDVCAAVRNQVNQRTWLQARRRADMSKVKPFSAFENQGLTKVI